MKDSSSDAGTFDNSVGDQILQPHFRFPLPQDCQTRAAFSKLSPCLSKKQFTRVVDHYFGLKGCLCLLQFCSQLLSLNCQHEWQFIQQWTRISDNLDGAILDQSLLSEFPAHRCLQHLGRSLHVFKSSPLLIYIFSQMTDFLFWTVIYPSIRHHFMFFKLSPGKIEKIIHLYNKCNTFIMKYLQGIHSNLFPK